MLWNNIYNAYVRELIYTGHEAGLDFISEVAIDTIEFKWFGFNDRMQDYIFATLSKINEMKNGNLERLFNIVKEEILRLYDNFYLGRSQVIGIRCI